ncbi:hypothetical protein GCM10007320_03370 [Pseudorhodoferax aquiterrae]|uniref:histidine kinase n=1 Tax=Pseudorhodoferax aquiterrae TaxID=747304 RepID=A0ABQ3FWC0_9BURK|nr:ATP-binding protein [Pseudorhodoferax aquiterrae]GHC69674.1 hypothetical protein GCM10007320_03370 [Pseudorhodoferax aquiterrae]
MKRLSAWLAEPTLVRRSTWSVLLAFVVVWAALLAYEYALNRQALATGPSLQKFGHALLGALAEIDDAAQARAALAATARWVNERRPQDQRFTGRYRFALADQDGQTVFASPGFTADAAQPAHPVSYAEIDGRQHRIFKAGAGRWTLRVAEPQRMPADFLAYNALHYGGPGCTVQVTLSAGPAQGWSLCVQDDGPGIAPPERARVFDRFFRGAGQSASGSGLGLAIVRQAALRLGGSVAIAPGLAGRGVGLQLRVPAQT